MNNLAKRLGRGNFWPDLLAEVQVTGHLSGIPAKVVYILGRRDSGWGSTTALNDFAQYLTDQHDVNMPTTGQTLYAFSDSTADTDDLEYVYLNSDGEEDAAVMALNGTTPISLGQGYKAIQWIELVSASSAGAVAAGNISITSATASSLADQTNTFEYIKEGGNRSLSGRYVIPEGWTGYGHSWKADAIGATIDVRLRADVSSWDRRLTEGAFHFHGTAYVSSGDTRGDYELDYEPLPSGATIKGSAIPNSTLASARGDINFDLVLLQKST